MNFENDHFPDCPICCLAASEPGGPCIEASLGGARAILPKRHVEDFSQLSFGEASDLFNRLATRFSGGAADERSFTVRSGTHFHITFDQGEEKQTGGGLIRGEDDPILGHLIRHIDAALHVDLAVAFALESGVALLQPYLQDLLDRGGRLRLVVGDYLDVTEPSALHRLMDLEGQVARHIFETQGGSFHVKAWVFHAQGGGNAIVGSSNLTRTALTNGVEWNLATGSDRQRWQEVSAAFDALLRHPRVRPLTADWIEGYASRRSRVALPDQAAKIAEESPPDPVPDPHPIQAEALAALGAIRDDGAGAGLVVLATGLGKTWLAAFDSREFDRVLFVAHREEILTQAMATFRRIRPGARFGRYDGSAKDDGAEILFASIQTLGRTSHLERFAADRFDYIVVDEFHHAAAATYRRLLDHFTPRFLLGLTATPERTDGGDLLHLCDHTLVYRCDLFEGITRGLLSPFHYWGVPDPVDYAQIPWRSSHFDEAELTRALATQTRAQNALEQFRLRGAGPALGFCCTVAHADFMADAFRAAGVRAVAVHSGPGTAPRQSSLDALARGELDIVFAVDMFNEGVDVPAIGTVLMLRPTESAIIWLQQLGRGLRKAEGKDALHVIDYIGNHRSFLTKARALLSAPEGDRALDARLEAVLSGEAPLPPGCDVTYDLEAVDILRALLRSREIDDDMEAFFVDFRLRHGRRPTALEVWMSDFDPRAPGHGGWIGFLQHMEEPIDPRLETAGRGLFLDTSRRADEDALLWLSDALDAGLAAGVEPDFALSAPLAADPARAERARGFWTLSHLTERNGLLRFVRIPDPLAEEAAVLLQELVEWRLAAVREEPPEREANDVDDPPATFESGTAPELWRTYDRPEIPRLFGATFNPGSWNQGIVRVGNKLILLTTLRKGSMAAGNHYEDTFLDPQTMQWQSQTSTRQASRHGAMISGREAGAEVHLFVRASKLRTGKAAPFTYCGQVRFLDWEGERPITVRFRLPEALPRHLRPSFGLKDGSLGG